MEEPTDEAQHPLRLQAIKRRRLQAIEEQIAAYGESSAPAHLLVERAELRAALGVVESVISSPLQASIGDELGERWRFVAYIEQLRRVEQSIGQVGKRVESFIEDSMDWRGRISMIIVVIIIIVVLLALFVAFQLGRISDMRALIGVWL